MSLVGPEPFPSNPLVQLGYDWRAERNARRAHWPPGDDRFNARRSHRLTTDPLGLLLDAYERHGPVFSVRLLSSKQMFMLGPEANHTILVSRMKDFRWRDGGFSQLIPLLGDGMLDDRRGLPPPLAQDHAAVVPPRADRREHFDHGGRDRRAPSASGATARRSTSTSWARRLALRIAMRALFGFAGDDRAAARDFEVALGFYGHDYVVQTLRGPRTPWARMHEARRRLDALIYHAIEARRRTGERGLNVLSLLLDATDEDGNGLSDRHIRDHVMTLLFAGHDTTTATIAFLFYELDRHPEEREALEQDGERLERCLDETLRMYPPAWIGPRRAVRDVEFAGYTVPADMPVAYSSYVSHRLPHVFPDPHTFRPDRMAPEAKAKLPRGAYVPFGGGSRICLGMRFGQAEIRTIARRILGDFRLHRQPGFQLEIRQTPTLGPRRGLPMTVRRT